MQQPGGKREMGGTDFKWGSRVPLRPPRWQRTCKRHPLFTSQNTIYGLGECYYHLHALHERKVREDTRKS